MVIDTLSLENVNIINARAEEYSKITREKYDIVVSRAVAPLKHLLEYSIPLLKINGHFIALKSNIDLELKNIHNYYQKLFLTNQEIINFNLPYENSYRTIYQIEKIKSTPTIYPRTYSQIKKRDIFLTKADKSIKITKSPTIGKKYSPTPGKKCFINPKDFNDFSSSSKSSYSSNAIVFFAI